MLYDEVFSEITPFMGRRPCKCNHYNPLMQERDDEVKTTSVEERKDCRAAICEHGMCIFFCLDNTWMFTPEELKEKKEKRKKVVIGGNLTKPADVCIHVGNCLELWVHSEILSLSSDVFATAFHSKTGVAASLDEDDEDNCLKEDLRTINGISICLHTYVMFILCLYPGSSFRSVLSTMMKNVHSRSMIDNEIGFALCGSHKCDECGSDLSAFDDVIVTQKLRLFHARCALMSNVKKKLSSRSDGGGLKTWDGSWEQTQSSRSPFDTTYVLGVLALAHKYNTKNLLKEVVAYLGDNKVLCTETIKLLCLSFKIDVSGLVRNLMISRHLISGGGVNSSKVRGFIERGSSTEVKKFYGRVDTRDEIDKLILSLHVLPARIRDLTLKFLNDHRMHYVESNARKKSERRRNQMCYPLSRRDV